MDQELTLISNLEENICIYCGFCCDGTLFNWAKIDKEESLDHLTELNFSSYNDTKIFTQPCGYLIDCKCSIYNSSSLKRPNVCGEFKCKLFRKIEKQKVTSSESIEVIEKTKKMIQESNVLIMDAFPDLAKLSSSMKIKSIKTKLENSDDKQFFRKQFGNVLLKIFILENWLDKHFRFGKIKKEY